MTSRARRDRVDAVLAALAWAAVAWLVGTIVWALPRGFDLTDEGFYALDVADPKPGFTSYGLVVRMFVPGEPGVVALRAARLAGSLASSILLALALVAFLRRAGPWRRMSRGAAATLVALVVAGGLAAWARYPQTLSYNSLTAILLVFAAAAVLDAGRRGRGPALALDASAGACLGLVFFLRFPTAVLALPLLAGLAAATRGVRGGARASAALVVGGALAAGAFFAFACPFGAWRDAAFGAVRDVGSTTHAPSALLRRFARDVGDAALGTALPFAAAALLAALVAARARAGRRAPPGVRAGVAVATVGAVLHVSATGLPGVPLSGFAPAVAGTAWVFVATVVVRRPRAPGLARRTAVAALLAALPLAASVGSDNAPRIQALQTLAPACGALAVLGLEGGRVRAFRRLVALLAPALCVVIASRVHDGLVAAPFRLRPLREQTEPVPELPRLAGLRVAPDARRFLLDTDEALRRAGFARGDALIVLHDLSGVVYAVGGRSPGANFFSRTQSLRNAAALRSVPEEERRALVVAVDSRRASIAEATLRDAGLRFPEDYEAVATVAGAPVAEFVTVWRPRAPR